MSLPTSRNTTYTADAPIKSVDLNDIQDLLINLHAGSVLAVPWMPLPLAMASGFDNCAHNEPAGYIESSGAPWAFDVPILLLAGAQVRNVRMYRFGGGSSTMTLRLKKVELTAGTPTASTVKSLNISSPAAAWTQSDLAMVMGDWVTIASTRLAYVRVEGAASGQRVSLIEALVGR